MSRIRDCHTDDDILKLLSLAYAAIEWNAGRISDDDMRTAARQFGAAWSEDETGGEA